MEKALGAITIHGVDEASMSTAEGRLDALRRVLGAVSALVYRMREEDGFDGIVHAVQSRGRPRIVYEVRLENAPILEVV